MKSYHYSRDTVQLSEDSIATLYRKLDVTDTPDTTKFLNVNPPEDHTFYQLVAQVLTLNGVSTIIAPNQWEPINLFYQLGRVLKAYDIELLDENENKDYEAYDISFSIDGVNESITVDTDDPSQLFNTINRHLKDSEFVRLISHLKQRRRVEWLLIPVPFDSVAFRQLTGCSAMREDWKPKLVARYTKGRIPTISQVNKLDKKVFFVPGTFCFVNGEVRYLSYTNPRTGETSFWAGRVMPGQTFKEAITVELKETLNYDGRFEFYNFGFLDYAPDKTGEQIERYGFSLKLFEPVESTTTSRGLMINLTSSPVHQPRPILNR